MHQSDKETLECTVCIIDSSGKFNLQVEKLTPEPASG